MILNLELDSRAQRKRFPLAASIIALVATVCFLVSWGIESFAPRTAQEINTALSNSPSLVRDRFWLWQVFTANLLHRDFVHLAMNVFPLVWMLSRLERRFGPRSILLLCAASGTVAYGAYDLLFVGIDYWDETVGLSGCLAAVAVFFVWVYPGCSLVIVRWLKVPLAWFVSAWVITDCLWFWSPLFMPSVNRGVHLCGAAFGLVLGIRYRWNDSMLGAKKRKQENG